MSLRHSLLLTVVISGFALTGCESQTMSQAFGFAPPDTTNQASGATTTSTASTPASSVPAPMVTVDSGVAPVTASATTSDAPQPTQTIVGRQIAQLQSDLGKLQSDVATDSATLNDLRTKNQSLATNYYTIIGEINAKLQSGTTPGNPRLVQRWQDASTALDQFAAVGNDMNALSSKIAASASMANYLLDAARATFGLSGAVDEDHAALKTLEDDVQRIVIGIGRVLTDLTRDIERQDAYVSAERRNLQTLSLAIARGEVYGDNLSNVAAAPPAMLAQSSDFGRAAPVAPVAAETLAPRPGVLGQLPADAVPAAKAPFVIIRFDRPDVDYGQPLYQAMSQALEKNPLGSFEVLAVSPSGPGARQTLASTTARGKAEDVMRTMAEMGVPADRMQLTTATSPDATSPEVHLFLK